MSTQGPRPIRLAGFALIGVAIVAVGVGVFALTSNGSGEAQGRPPVTSTPAPPPPTTTTTKAKPPPTTTKPPTTTAPTTTTTTTVPVTTVVPPPATTQAPTLKQTMAVRVYNNSKIKNLAAVAAEDFRGDGFNVVEVGNYSQGVIPTSTVYYSSAPGEQEVATDLAHEFSMKVAPRFSGIAFASPGVIVIVTKDFQTGKK